MFDLDKQIARSYVDRDFLGVSKGKEAEVEAYAARKAYTSLEDYDSAQLLATQQLTAINDFRENPINSAAITELEDFINNADLEYPIDPNYSEEDYVTLKDGRKYPKLLYEKAINQETHFNELLTNVAKSKALMVERLDEIKDAEQQFSVYQRDYDLWEKAADLAGVGLLEIGVNLLVAGKKYSDPQTYVDMVMGTQSISPLTTPLLTQFTKFANDARDYHSMDITFDEALGLGDNEFSWSNFGEYGVTLVANQLPILATVVATGGSGSMILPSIVLGSSAMGGKYREMSYENYLLSEDFRKQVDHINDLPNKSEEEKKRIINELENNMSEERFSEAEMMLKGTGFGMAEGFFSYLTTVPLYNRGMKMAKDLRKGKLMDDGMKKYIINNAPKSLVYEPALEGAGELGTTCTQNLIDGRPILTGAAESFFSGVLLGQMFTGTPFMSGMITRTFSSDKEFKVINEQTRTIAELQIQNEILKQEIHGGVPSYQIDGVDVTKEEIVTKIKEVDPKKGDIKFSVNNDIEVTNILNEKFSNPKVELDSDVKKQTELHIKSNEHVINALTKERDTQLKEQEDKIRKNGMSKMAFQNVQRVITEQHGLHMQAQSILENDSFTTEQKKKLLTIIKNQFNSLEADRRKFNNKATFGHGYFALKGVNVFSKRNSKDTKLYEKIQEEALSRIVSEKGKDYDVTQEDLDKKGMEVYDEIMLDEFLAKNKKMKGNKLDIIQETDDAVNLYKELSKDDLEGLEGDVLAKKKLEIADNVNAIKNKSVNGFNYKGKEYVVRENAIHNQRTQTGTHEIGHSVFTELLGSDPEAFAGVGEQIKTFLEQRDPGALKRMEISNTGIFNEDGSVNNEELIMSFIEEVGNDKINLNNTKLKGLPSLIGFMFNTGMKKASDGTYDIDFKGETDVIRFVAGLGKKIAEGTLSKADIEAAKTGEVVTKAKEEAKKKEKKKEISPDKLSFSKTASDKVQSIYEKQGPAGAFDIIEQFKPIVNKIVEKRREAPGFDKQLLTDEIETGERGILDLINAYKPESGVPLAAYINKYLPARAIEASRRVLGEVFESDITETRGIVEQSAEEDIIEQAETVKEKPKAKTTRKKLGIETGSELYNKVKAAVAKTFGTKLPDPDSPDFRKELNKAYRTELKKPIADLLGTRAKYKEFLETNWENLYDAIPQSILNKRFKQFIEPVMGKDGKQVREKTAVGKGMFQKRDISKQEFLDYFLSQDVGASTRGTRKDALAEAIGEELALDATMEVIQDPKVLERYEQIRELEGKPATKETIPKISEQVERARDVKFSKNFSEEKVNKIVEKHVQLIVGALNRLDKGTKKKIIDKDIIKLIYGDYRKALTTEFENFKEGDNIAEALRKATESFLNNKKITIGDEIKNKIKEQTEKNIEVFTSKEFADGKSFGKALRDLINNSLETVRKLLVYEIKDIGHEASIDVLKNRIKEVKGKDAKVKMLKDWFRNESRSTRSFFFIGLTTNDKVI